MNLDQIINTFMAGEHKVTIYSDDNGRYVLVLARDAHFTQSWLFATYDKALSVAEWLDGLTAYQLDILILGVQLVLDKLERVIGGKLDDTQK